jgi:hypothetical protein
VTYSAAPFAHRLESGIAGAALVAVQSMRAEAERDRSGERAVAKLSHALRMERRRSSSAEARLADVEAELEATRQRLAGAEYLLRLHDVG